MTAVENNYSLPRHIAIIMDGNGRWASQRGQPRIRGHQAGVNSLRAIVEHCARLEVRVLTVFVFSSENWRRPPQEVRRLLDLFITSLQEQFEMLRQHRVRLSFIGDRSAFPPKLRQSIDYAEVGTAGNQGLHLVVAANYGGRWDIATACSRIAREVSQGKLQPEEVDESMLARYVCLADEPEPDLLIRTGEEQRISNYLLWQCAYSEFYFTETLWPDFTPDCLDQAIAWFSGRQRRFGRTEEQLVGNEGGS